MNAMTPDDQRRTLEARIAMLERCLRTHGLMAGVMPSKHEPHWAVEFLDGRKDSSDGRAIVRQAVKDAAKDAGILPETILAPGRLPHIAQARRNAMLRAFEAGASYSQIARAMRRDHTTVMHGVRKAREEMQ